MVSSVLAGYRIDTEELISVSGDSWRRGAESNLTVIADDRVDLDSAGHPNEGTDEFVAGLDLPQFLSTPSIDRMASFASGVGSCLGFGYVILSSRDELKFGGAGRNRTADRGFADLGLTTWRPRRYPPQQPQKPAFAGDTGMRKTLAGARGQHFWSGRRDLNPRLRPWQGRTLPLSYSRSAVSIIAVSELSIERPTVTLSSRIAEESSAKLSASASCHQLHQLVLPYRTYEASDGHHSRRSGESCGPLHPRSGGAPCPDDGDASRFTSIPDPTRVPSGPDATAHHACQARKWSQRRKY